MFGLANNSSKPTAKYGHPAREHFIELELCLLSDTLTWDGIHLVGVRVGVGAV